MQQHFHSSLAKTLLRKTRTHAILITNLTNIQWLTGLSLSAGMMLITKDDAILFLDNRYREMAQKSHLKEICIESLREAIAIICSYRTIAYEAEHVTMMQYERWNKKIKNTKFVQSMNLIESLRREKSREEIHIIRSACQLTKSILRTIPSLLKIGITEKQLAWDIEKMAREQGARCMAFDTIVAFAENTSIPHHHPTRKKLQKKDIIQIDMGIDIDGYKSDYSEVFFTGEKTKEQHDVLSILKNVKKTVIAEAKTGVSVRTLDILARTMLQEHGLEKAFCHSLGHGVGLDIHELPTISKKVAPSLRLKKHEVITIEPGVYFPGKWGMRVEETIVVDR